MTSAKQMAEGDRVEHTIHIGADVKKTQAGTVIDVGRSGVQVRFDDEKIGVRWMKGTQVRVVERARADKPARVESQAPVSVVVPIASARSAPPVSTASSQVASDLAAWREMGRSLEEGARVRVHFAKEEREAAREAVNEAQSRLVQMAAAVDEAERDLAALVRVVGEQPISVADLEVQARDAARAGDVQALTKLTREIADVRKQGRR